MQLTASVPQGLTGQLRIWLNGRLYDDPHQASVAGTDHGLVVGDGVFETLKVTERGAFAVEQHLDRLNRSAAALALPTPDHGEIREAIDAVLNGRDFPRGKLRITFTGGRGPLSSEAPYGPPTLIIMGAGDAAPQFTSIVTAPGRATNGALARREVHVVRRECS